MDLSEGTNFWNEVAVESTKRYFDGETIGDVNCVKLHPAPIAQDLCSVRDLPLSLFIEPS